METQTSKLLISRFAEAGSPKTNQTFFYMNACVLLPTSQFVMLKAHDLLN
jgi:hypothetical protein